jgi:hypothetical protein
MKRFLAVWRPTVDLIARTSAWRALFSQLFSVAGLLSQAAAIAAVGRIIELGSIEISVFSSLPFGFQLFFFPVTFLLLGTFLVFSGQKMNRSMERICHQARFSEILISLLSARPSSRDLKSGQLALSQHVLHESNAAGSLAQAPAFLAGAAVLFGLAMFTNPVATLGLLLVGIPGSAVMWIHARRQRLSTARFFGDVNKEFALERNDFLKDLQNIWVSPKGAKPLTSTLTRNFSTSAYKNYLDHYDRLQLQGPRIGFFAGVLRTLAIGTVLLLLTATASGSNEASLLVYIGYLWLISGQIGGLASTLSTLNLYAPQVAQLRKFEQSLKDNSFLPSVSMSEPVKRRQLPLLIVLQSPIPGLLKAYEKHNLGRLLPRPVSISAEGTENSSLTRNAFRLWEKQIAETLNSDKHLGWGRSNWKVEKHNESPAQPSHEQETMYWTTLSELKGIRTRDALLIGDDGTWIHCPKSWTRKKREEWLQNHKQAQDSSQAESDFFDETTLG